MSAASFVWYDLMTTDLEAARTFYGAVVGWTFTDTGSQPPYFIINGAAGRVGGLMPIPPGSPSPPIWKGYIAVENLEEASARLKGAGGVLHHGPEDIPGVGRFAVVADLQGALFILITPAEGWSGAADAPMSAAGHVAWRELMAGDGPSAFDFYKTLFGWTPGEAMDMGPMGVYQLFATGGDPVGGMMTTPPDVAAPPHWQYYFTVPDIDAAIGRVTAGGGQVIVGPMEVPGGMWVMNGLDPQGGLFSLLGPRLQ